MAVVRQVWDDSGRVYAAGRARSGHIRCGDTGSVVTVDQISVAGSAAPVRVWWADTRLVDEADRALLNPEEQLRMSRYVRSEDRDRFAAGVALSRRVVGETVGIEPAAVRLDRRCAVCGQPHGRPRSLDALEQGIELDFSISHAGTYAVLATCTLGRVGVDVETADVDADDQLAVSVLSSPELARVRSGESFARLWVAKEAALKAVGLGLRVDMRSVSVGPIPVGAGDAGWVDVPDGLTDAGDPTGQVRGRLHSVDAPSGYVAAVVTLEDR